MAKPKKDGHSFNCFLDRQLYNRLCYYAEKKGQTKTLAVERILKEHLDRENVPTDIPNQFEATT